MSNIHRTQSTQQIIQTHFLKLLYNNPIEKITVRELCACANVHRGTFYCYYADLYDLAYQIEEELYEKFQKIIAASLDSSLFEIIKQCIYLIYEEQLVCAALFKYKNSTEFFHRVTDMSRTYIYNQAAFRTLNETEKLYIFNYLCAGVLGMIQTWINGNFQESPDNLIHYLDVCLGDLIHLSKGS